MSVSVEEGYDEAWSNGTVSTNGDDWKATGKYKVTVEACEFDEGNCYDWQQVCSQGE